MFTSFKKNIVRFSKWAQDNWLAMVIFSMAGMLGFVSLIAFSWLFGYWSNALYGTKFELNSCWQGITAVITGMGGVAALAKAAWTKYRTDSEFNSKAGEIPQQPNYSHHYRSNTDSTEGAKRIENLY